MLQHTHCKITEHSTEKVFKVSFHPKFGPGRNTVVVFSVSPFVKSFETHSVARFPSEKRYHYLDIYAIFKKNNNSLYPFSASLNSVAEFKKSHFFPWESS